MKIQTDETKLYLPMPSLKAKASVWRSNVSVCEDKDRGLVEIRVALAGEATSFLDNTNIKTYRNLHQKHIAENATRVEALSWVGERPNN